MKRKLGGMLVCMPLLLFAFTMHLQANKESNYYVRAELPENQINKNNSYFDLLVEPGTEQTLVVHVFNTSDESIAVKAMITNAATNTNGTIMYTTRGIKDSSMAISIEDVARLKEDTMVVEPQSSSVFEIQLVLPEKKFQGVLLGGIVVETAYLEESSTSEEQNSIKIENKLTYVIGLKLQEDLHTVVVPNINYLGTKELLHDISSAVGIHLQNSEAIIMKGVQVDAEIYRKTSNKILYEYHNNAVEIAPNSSFDVAVIWGNEKLKEGTYRLKLCVQFEEYVWEWNEDFRIDSKKANVINEEAINIKFSLPTWVHHGIRGFLALVLFMSAFLLGRVNGKKRD